MPNPSNSFEACWADLDATILPTIHRLSFASAPTKDHLHAYDIVGMLYSWIYITQFVL